MAAQRARLSGGRWHFQHGPIDIVIGAEGDAPAVDAAHEAAWLRFETVLAELVAELPALRSRVMGPCPLRGKIAQRMWWACRPHHAQFITPMAAVAGAVAQELIAAYALPGVQRAWVNNGGDIALHLAPGTQVRVGLYADLGRLRAAGCGSDIRTWNFPDTSLGLAAAEPAPSAPAASEYTPIGLSPTPFGLSLSKPLPRNTETPAKRSFDKLWTVGEPSALLRAGFDRLSPNGVGQSPFCVGQSPNGAGRPSNGAGERTGASLSDVHTDGHFDVHAADPVRGIATSGWRGRSLSLGIADSVTVLARTAAEADAAATVIANAVNVDDARIRRRPANEVRDDSDLGEIEVVVDVPPLPLEVVRHALQQGERRARELQLAGLIHAAVLVCQGQALRVEAAGAAARAPRIEVGSVFA